MRKVALLFLLLTLSIGAATAQMVDPVKWTYAVTPDKDQKTGHIDFTATIEAGWHMYSFDVDPEVGPTPLSFNFEEVKGMELVGSPAADKAPHKEYDDLFEAELSWWTSKVVVKQKVRFTSDHYSASGLIRFSACNDESCIPPQKLPFEVSGALQGAAPAPKEEAVPADTVAQKPDTVAALVAPAAGSSPSQAELWAPVTLQEEEKGEDFATTSLWYVFFTCVIGGFVALLTPCVWPLIPMTVSFFLKKGKSRAKSISDAIIYGVSIIVIYVLLGLAITIIFGASALNALSTSAIFNIIFFLLLVLFAVSFFGAFDIKLPSKWSNHMDATAEKTTGMLSIFFMAFTLVLVSFSCTGPIIGTLLVEAATTGERLGPAVGMFGFSLALALPFCLFAMFPSWLKSAPRSGGWMGTVKVVLGFLELALSLKFLSVADLAYGWHVLDRETFIALWIATFGLLGLYLLGVFAFKHYGRDEEGIGVFRFFLALISLSFTVYLVPGLWGAPLKSVSAFVPPLFTQDFNLYGGGFQTYHDYEEGMAEAARSGKPVLVDFSGYGCVNCRKMEGAVLDQPDIKAMIEDNFVFIELMVDEKKALPEPRTIEENGRKMRLETYGDLYSYLQRFKFQANAQPYYVVLNARGELLSGPYTYDENIARFARFLEKGMKEN